MGPLEYCHFTSFYPGDMAPHFDLSSDFPTLGNRGGLQQSGGAQNVRNYGELRLVISVILLSK